MIAEQGNETLREEIEAKQWERHREQLEELKQLRRELKGETDEKD